MPIRPENRALYPKDWPAISLEVRERAGWRCEGSPAFPEGCPRHPSRLPYGDGDNPSEGFGLRIELVKSAHFERFAPAIRLPEEGT